MRTPNELADVLARAEADDMQFDTADGGARGSRVVIISAALRDELVAVLRSPVDLAIARQLGESIARNSKLTNEIERLKKGTAQ